MTPRIPIYGSEDSRFTELVSFEASGFDYRREHKLEDRPRHIADPTPLHAEMREIFDTLELPEVPVTTEDPSTPVQQEHEVEQVEERKKARHRAESTLAQMVLGIKK